MTRAASIGTAALIAAGSCVAVFAVWVAYVVGRIRLERKHQREARGGRL